MVATVFGIFTGIIVSIIFDKFRQNDIPFYMYILTYIACVVIMLILLLLFFVAGDLLKELPVVIKSVYLLANSV